MRFTISDGKSKAKVTFWDAFAELSTMLLKMTLSILSSLSLVAVELPSGKVKVNKNEYHI